MTWPRFQEGCSGTSAFAHSSISTGSPVSGVTDSPSAAEMASCTVTERQDPPMSCSAPSARLITVDPNAATAAPCASNCVSSPIVL